MAEDWAADVRKYAPDADEAVIAGIVRHCGIALRTRDASLVAFGDPSELETVRESFLKRKLGLAHSDEELDAAIAEVGEMMKADPTKNRVTVYYLLAEKFGKLGLFAGATAAAASAANDPETPVVQPELPVAPPPPPPPPEPVRAAAIPAAAAAPLITAHAPSRRLEPEPRDDGGVVGTGLATLGVLAVAILGAAVGGALIGGRTGDPPAPPASTLVAVAPAVPAAPAVPEGMGVVADTVAGRPQVSVYFATASAEVTPEFAAAAAPMVAYLEANPGARLAVSGYNDPRGDRAFNEELSKNRAQNVAAALVAMGVPEDAIALEKPADATDTDVSLAEARRVDIMVRDGG